jgi:hypothetical protein
MIRQICQTPLSHSSLENRVRAKILLLVFLMEHTESQTPQTACHLSRELGSCGDSSKIVPQAPFDFEKDD